MNAVPFEHHTIAGPGALPAPPNDPAPPEGTPITDGVDHTVPMVDHRAAGNAALSARRTITSHPIRLDAAAYKRATAALDRSPMAFVRKRLARAHEIILKDGDPNDTPLNYGGIDLLIDRPKGFVQTGTKPDGSAWRRTYLYDYGYVPGTEGGDGEGLDVYVGPEDDAPTAYWVAQRAWDGTFDEWKVFLGFPSPERAAFAFIMHAPAELLGPIFEIPVAAMSALLGLDPGSPGAHGGHALIANMASAVGKAGEGGDGGASAEAAAHAVGEAIGHLGSGHVNVGHDPKAPKAPKAKKPKDPKPKEGEKPAAGKAPEEGKEHAAPKAKPKGGGGGPGRDEHGRFAAKAAGVIQAEAEATMEKTTDRRTKVRKDADISFDDLRSQVAAAIDLAFPPTPPTDGCSPCSTWLTDLFDAYGVFQREGTLWKVGYSYANGVVTITGDPVPVVRSYTEVTGTPGTGAAATTTTAEGLTMGAKAAATNKDAAGAPTSEGGEDASANATNDGADIVLLAFDRLSDIVDTINAGGGTLTPETRQALDGVCALLETVAPDDDSDMDADPVDGAPAVEVAAAAKRADVRKRYVNGRSLVRKLARLMATAKAEKDPTKKAALQAGLKKGLDYGNEVFGSETQFMSSTLGQAIPEFTDPSQLKPTEGTLPAAGTPSAQFAMEKPSFGGGNTTTDVAGTAQATEKLAKLRASLEVIKAAVKPEALAEVEKNRMQGPGTWSPAYLNSLPDSAYLYVEEGTLKDETGRSIVSQGPGSGFRHFAVRDVTGQLSIPQIQKAIAGIPQAGLLPEVKAALLKQAQDLLAKAEALAASALSKADRGDDGWPENMNDPAFKKGEAKAPPMFGNDNLLAKAKSRKAALDEAKAKGGKAAGKK